MVPVSRLIALALAQEFQRFYLASFPGLRPAVVTCRGESECEMYMSVEIACTYTRPWEMS